MAAPRYLRISRTSPTCLYSDMGVTHIPCIVDQEASVPEVVAVVPSPAMDPVSDARGLTSAAGSSVVQASAAVESLHLESSGFGQLRVHSSSISQDLAVPGNSA